MNFEQKGLETLKTGGYVVFIMPSEKGSGVSFVGLWSNPESDEYEINQGDMVRQEPIRTDGEARRHLYQSELLQEYFSLVEKEHSSGPNFIYSYTPNTVGTLPEGFEEVKYLIPYRGVFKALSDTGELLTLVPESSAMHLFVECGIPYTSGFMRSVCF